MSNSEDWVFQNVLNLFWEIILNKLEKDIAFVFPYLLKIWSLLIKLNATFSLKFYSHLLSWHLVFWSVEVVTYLFQIGMELQCCLMKKTTTTTYGSHSFFIIKILTIFQRSLYYYVQKQAVDKEQAIWNYAFSNLEKNFSSLTFSFHYSQSRIHKNLKIAIVETFLTPHKLIYIFFFWRIKHIHLSS